MKNNIKMNEVLSFNKIAKSFDSNIHAIRNFNENIGSFADKKDREIINSFVKDLEKILGQPLRSKEDLPPDELEAKNNNADKLTEEALVKFQEKEPEKFDKLIKASNSFLKKNPKQGLLLRRGLLVTLISHFEDLISDLLHLFYSLHPEAMPEDNRQLSLSDLKNIGSIEEAEKYLVAKEIENVLRDNLEDQLKYFSRRPSLSLNSIEEHFEELFEISQRRNLYVHNNGIVNRTYLGNVSDKYIEKNEIKEGQKMPIHDGYIEQAINKIHLVGILLIQIAWRKWKKEENHAADSFLVDLIFYSLQEDQFDFVNKVCIKSLDFNVSTEDYRLILSINRAIALKRLEQIEEMQLLIDSIDWSAVSLRFLVALKALNEEFEELLSLLDKAISIDKLTEEEVKTWPLFEEFRDSKYYEKFKQNFENKNVT